VSGVCRDPDEDTFLACAASGKAAFLVSGDKDLCALGKFSEVRIITLEQLLRKLEDWGKCEKSLLAFGKILFMHPDKSPVRCIEDVLQIFSFLARSQTVKYRCECLAGCSLRCIESICRRLETLVCMSAPSVDAAYLSGDGFAGFPGRLFMFPVSFTTTGYPSNEAGIRFRSSGVCLTT